MKRLGSLGAVLPFLALGATACGANTTQSTAPDHKFTPLADFEKSMGFNMNPLWNGGFDKDADMSPQPTGYMPIWKIETLSPARPNPDGTMSTQALHKSDAGVLVAWARASLLHVAAGKILRGHF